MENRYQLLLPKQGRPTIVIQPVAMRLLALDVPKTLSQRQFKRVKKQRLAAHLDQHRSYRSYVLDRYELPNNRWRYWLAIINCDELMAEWRACYQRFMCWPVVSLGVLQLKSMVEKYLGEGRLNLTILHVTTTTAVWLSYQQNKLQDYQQFSEPEDLRYQSHGLDEIWVISASAVVEQRWLMAWQRPDQIRVVTEDQLRSNAGS